MSLSVGVASLSRHLTPMQRIYIGFVIEMNWDWPFRCHSRSGIGVCNTVEFTHVAFGCKTVVGPMLALVIDQDKGGYK